MSAGRMPQADADITFAIAVGAFLGIGLGFLTGFFGLLLHGGLPFLVYLRVHKLNYTQICVLHKPKRKKIAYSVENITQADRKSKKTNI